jgi:hypothetical protein
MLTGSRNYGIISINFARCIFCECLCPVRLVNNKGLKDCSEGGKDESNKKL